jgi:hypothetical protein
MRAGKTSAGVEHSTPDPTPTTIDKETMMSFPQSFSRRMPDRSPGQRQPCVVRGFAHRVAPSGLANGRNIHDIDQASHVQAR